jgi:hypothetical protein
MAETIQKAATKYLLSVSEVVNAVGKFDVSLKPFIFRDEMLANLESNEYAPVSAVVVEDGGPIATPTITRFRSRRLRVTIWANGTRDALGNLTDPSSVEEKINDTFLVLDKYLHRTDPAPVLWSTIVTISSDRIGDISEPVGITDGDGIKIASVNYAVYF